MVNNRMASVALAVVPVAAALLMGALLAPAARAELKVEDIRAKGKASAKVRFTYRNTTSTSFSSVVITCASPNAQRREQKGVHYFTNHLSGGIAPGFVGSATLNVPLKGAKPDSITCAEEGMPLNF
ncbi:MAG: hypothetical protein HOJ95_14500 [Nitrospinaceae bacterium]|jgi:hypothetical protein|nr:hypothetical protein [Nitrospinaceae bacterium]MBT3434724.1 hypothetical protein [Nitrospinaceae bacterium]MBT3821170.1 hypothetical protein [Nitrospinaceae bacterium]MBT4093574.1 hypothetical protein [Nitrospinaceae bacterium]MBT5368858.1 hypothetical protein [Nitrospinaceae bacterium]